jgi:hypothetical protein
MVIISAELISRETSPPKDDDPVEPSSEVASEKELEAADICVIVDSEG